MGKGRRCKDDMHAVVSRAIHDLIKTSDFVFQPPHSQKWADLMHKPNAAKKDRLEFLGDAVLHLVFAYELYERYPTRDAGFYTKLRSALTTNMTFILLMQKAGLDNWLRNKAVADEFESMVAALFLQEGLSAVIKYVQREFNPLINAAERRYDTGLDEMRANSMKWAKTRKQPDISTKKASKNKASKAGVLDSIKARKIRQLLEERKRSKAQRRTNSVASTLPAAAAVVIDLTGTDSEDEDEVLEAIGQPAGEDREDEEAEEEEDSFIPLPQTSSPLAGPSRLHYDIEEESESEEEDQDQDQELYNIYTPLGVRGQPDRAHFALRLGLESPQIAHIPPDDSEESASDNDDEQQAQGNQVDYDNWQAESGSDSGQSEGEPMSISSFDLGVDQGFEGHENVHDLRRHGSSSPDAEDEDLDRSRAMSISEADRYSVNEEADVDQLDGWSSHSRESSADSEVHGISHILMPPSEESRSPLQGAEWRTTETGPGGSWVEQISCTTSYLRGITTQGASDFSRPSPPIAGPSRQSLQSRLIFPGDLVAGTLDPAPAMRSVLPPFVRSSQLQSQLRSSCNAARLNIPHRQPTTDDSDEEGSPEADCGILGTANDPIIVDSDDE